jgi:EAL domain-containing protein (putative c-di-GMP-specific phosphodiesterase class I)
MSAGAVGEPLKLLLVEGVEGPEQFELLKKFNCEYYQGFYFSEPLSNRNMTAVPRGRYRR